ncbi:MAG: histidine kinase [Desulfovibrio sp.]|jgi:C4-dicarboxylate-specific signal transduction histidine kinase|nr:histidine kinase [Desulfovibrio sp.]
MNKILRTAPDPLRGDADAQGRAEQQAQSSMLAEALAGTAPRERARLARIVDFLPCYVVLVGLDHRIHFSNRAFEEFFGPVNNRPCYAALRGREEPCAYCAALDALIDNSACVSEWNHHKSKHAFRVYSYPFEETDGSRLALKVGFNITSANRVQQALDLSEQSYRVITDNLSIGVALLSPDLRVRASNSRLTAWFGHKMDQEERVCDVLHCPSYSETLARTGGFCATCPFQTAAQDKVVGESEFPIVLQDGGERMMRLVACPVAPRRGTVRALIMMLEDITQRLRVTQQLQRARKLEAMGTLAGGIAHEINQPLSALHLYASGLQMLLDRPGDVSPETTRERLSLIMREAERIRGIITHMRALVMREGTPPLEPVSLAQATAGALALMRQQILDRGITTRVEVPDSLPLVCANAGQMEQVLVNLMSNALHALDSSSARQTPKILLIRAREKDGGEKIQLEIADSGPGLPDGSERIFDPFYSKREGQQGMGLGLSIVHGFVTLWGGQVYVLPRHKELGGAGVFVDLRPASGTVGG